MAVSAGSRACYDWESSLDGGKTWVAAPSSLQAKTTLVGFTPGVTVMFRYRAVTKTGEGNWSQVRAMRGVEDRPAVGAAGRGGRLAASRRARER